jgi:hypothetical protein
LASIRRTPPSCIASSRRDTSGAYGRQFRGASADRHADDEDLREYDNPIRVEHTSMACADRAARADEERTHVRVTNQLFHGFVIPMSTGNDHAGMCHR